MGFLRLQPWSDLLKSQAEILLKQRLHLSDTKALQLRSDFRQIQEKKSLKNGWISQLKNDCNYG